MTKNEKLLAILLFFADLTTEDSKLTIYKQDNGFYYIDFDDIDFPCSSVNREKLIDAFIDIRDEYYELIKDKIDTHESKLKSHNLLLKEYTTKLKEINSRLGISVENPAKETSN